MQPTDPPFTSAHSALLFAYNYSAHDHAVAAAAERRLATFARERYENLPPSGTRGLTGTDGAAQAGMILSRIERLPPLHQASLIARFAVASPAERAAACMLLALKAAPDTRLGLFPLEQIMRRLHGLHVTIGQIADKHGVTDRTARRWQVEAIRWLRPVQAHAMDRAEQLLTEAGIVGRN